MAGKNISTFRKVNNFIHLWLGLITGLIMFIVCITGCLWVFQKEITNMVYPPLKIPVQQKPLIGPSGVLQLTDSLFPGKAIRYINYAQGEPVYVGVNSWDDNPFDLQVDPYTGKAYGKAPDKESVAPFFDFVRDGHRALWLPWEIGRPIVNYSTLLFIILLITGLIWWYPKKWNRSTFNKSFKIKWKASWKRVNIDLHNVLGFYSLLLLFALAITGITFGIEWFSKGYYWLTTGTQQVEWIVPESDSEKAANGYAFPAALDKAFQNVLKKHPDTYSLHIENPDTSNRKSSIEMTVNFKKGSFYTEIYYAFDRYTAKELTWDKVWGKPIEENTFGEKVQRFNYDIHVGSVLGLPGKILAFFASLIGASLPVTGFIIWYNRKFGKKRNGKLFANAG